MRILLFVDSLGPGGAQRQLVMLALGLKHRGHNVVVCRYAAGDFFVGDLVEQEIEVITLRNSLHQWQRPRELRRVLNQYLPDAIIAFTIAPNIYAELASAVNKKWKLIVSERSAIPLSGRSMWFKMMRQFHRVADMVTTNSFTNQTMIIESVPNLAAKCCVIYNGVDLDKFVPASVSHVSQTKNYVVLATHKPAKNFSCIANSIMIMLRRPTRDFHISWFGADESSLITEHQKMIDDMGIDSHISLYKPVNNVCEILQSSYGLILASLWEGLPNAVCESLACGCPVLASDIGDNPKMITHGYNGYLFDPGDPNSLADVLTMHMECSAEIQQMMRSNARKYAENHLSADNMIKSYETLCLR